MEELKEEYYLNRQKHILKVVCSRFVQVASIGLIITEWLTICWVGVSGFYSSMYGLG